MDDSRPQTRALMACLGDPSRFRLVQALIGQARCVTDLATEVGLSQSCTTRHLQALERRNVVRGTRDGKRVLYRIRDDRPDLMPLIGWAMEVHATGGRPAAEAGRGKRRINPGLTTDPGRPSGAARAAQAVRPFHPAAPQQAAGLAPPRQSDVPPPLTEVVRDQEPIPGMRRRSSELEDFLL